MNLSIVDSSIIKFMKRWSLPALRDSFAVIFIWFGMLKVIGISPAEMLVIETVKWMPFFSPDTWVVIIGLWEVLIGILFLFQSTTRIAIALLALQMIGTFLPLFILPEVTFQPGKVPYAPTLEGQYIIKNLLIISGALVLGSSVKGRPYSESKIR